MEEAKQEASGDVSEIEEAFGAVQQVFIDRGMTDIQMIEVCLVTAARFIAARPDVMSRKEATARFREMIILWQRDLKDSLT